jgi:hypothetical protein
MDAGSDASTIGAVLTPFLALVGAAIGAAVISWNNSTNVKIENITKERAKWRDSIRQKALNVQKAAASRNNVWLEELHLELTLLLNPFDADDRAILEVIRLLKSSPDDAHITEFGDRISLLLKHDWDRAKREAGEESIFCDPADFKPKPVRMTYEEYKLAQSKTPYRYT